jgi:hypothetical protein
MINNFALPFIINNCNIFEASRTLVSRWSKLEKKEKEGMIGKRVKENDLT